MKKFLLFLFVLLSTEVVLAQTPAPFLVTTAEGVPLYYRITDAVNKKVEVVAKPNLDIYDLSLREHYNKVIIPTTVTYGGVRYDVDKIAKIALMEIDSLYIPDDCKLGWQPFSTIKLKRLFMPKNLTVWPSNCMWYVSIPDGYVDELWINSKMKIIEPFGTWNPGWSIKRLRGFTSSNIEEIQNMSFDPNSGGADLINDLAILPQTIRVIDQGAFLSPLSLNKLTIPLSMENLGGYNYDISGDVYISHNTPFTLGGNAFGTQEAFAAGSVIPKQTGFILKGTAGSTVYYRAGLTGVTEVDVTGNLLVGTATEQEISGAGYKYYLFGKGAKGQGFYHQTGRDGNSIKLGAHRAGLKLATSGFAPAKELIFNFDDATTTGINNVQPAVEKKNDVIYDLQGRRVTNPSRGIYIVNGKKVVISK